MMRGWLSGIDLDFHAGVEEVLVVVGFAVLTHCALALFGTLDACAKTVAVVLSTLRFLASAPSLGDEGRDALEGAGVSEVGQLLGLVDLELAVFVVAAIVALALLIAEAAFGEALAVHLQAVDFGALAALEWLLAWGEVHV
jgi:hypothetical protein